MTDRELLGLAAKAAGIELFALVPVGRDEVEFLLTDRKTFWNPLTDDADAFRLLMHLGITKVVSLEVGSGGICMTVHHPYRELDTFRPLGDSPFDMIASARRAIVCAAAEVARAAVGVA